MIDFKVGVVVNFMFNRTEYEWHELQSCVNNYLSTKVLHCISAEFNPKEPSFTTKDEDVVIDHYVRLNKGALSIDVCSIQRDKECGK